MYGHEPVATLFKSHGATSVLTQARGRSLGITLAYQYMEQLTAHLGLVWY
jgi:hypothetical protein